jgi:hypothetical protein
MIENNEILHSPMICLYYVQQMTGGATCILSMDFGFQKTCFEIIEWLNTPT